MNVWRTISIFVLGCGNRPEPQPEPQPFPKCVDGYIVCDQSDPRLGAASPEKLHQALRVWDGDDFIVPDDSANYWDPDACETFYAYPYSCAGYTGEEPCKIVRDGPRVYVERCVEIYNEDAMLGGAYGWYAIDLPVPGQP